MAKTHNFVYIWHHSRLQVIDQCLKFPPFSSRQKIELTFMRLGGSGASPGNLSQLFSIVHEVAVDVFSDQDKAMTLNRWKLDRIDNSATGIWVAKACQCLHRGFMKLIFTRFIDLVSLDNSITMHKPMAMYDGDLLSHRFVIELLQ